MSKAGTPFKMKGSPFKRNFGIGASPMKKGLWESLTGKKFKETKLGKDIAGAGEQIKADVKRAGEIVKTGKATTPRKVAPKKGKGPKTLHEKKMEKKKEGGSGGGNYSTYKSVNALVSERTKWMEKNPNKASKDFPGQAEINKRLTKSPDKWD